MPTLLLEVAADHPAFSGHFPDDPVLPGVVLLDLAQQAIEVGIGHRLHGLATAKFLRPVRPGDALQLTYTPGAEAVTFELRCAGQAVANGRFVIEPVPR
ncbi:MAG: hypothetical protein OJF60_000203 [Burkholderiaceae bacterium]|jgi:3-hydroxymyristoyl/3-hydroxydecanoyl-(acyl carrier protein) dehydratase|nr:MAG: hypothetical protein OJF60_000203 [Burkholderiaceae bacterium]